MKHKSIAVFGQGFVGGSLTTVFAEKEFDVYVYDIAHKIAPGGKLPDYFDFDDYGFADYNDEINSFIAKCERQDSFSNVYFVCLPTPMYTDGSADLSIVESVLEKLATHEGSRIAVVKSTVPPGTVENWNKNYSKMNKNFKVIFNPEFLTEANALDDMRFQNRIILGGPRPHINVVKSIFQTAFPKVPLIKTSSTTAEMIKYFTNVQLASRVVLSCELSQICESLDKKGLDIDYDKVVEYAKYDSRLGGSHMNVPGNDGIPGMRGHCLPGNYEIIDTNYKKQNLETLYQLFHSGEKIKIIGTNYTCLVKEEKKITNVTKRLYEGNLICLTINDKIFKCTPEHLLPVIRNNELLIVKANDILITDELITYN